MRRIVMMFLLLLTAASMRATDSLTLDQYEAGLTRMRAFIQAGQVEAARGEAKSLAGCEVDSPNGPFRTDSTLLAEVATAKPHDLGVERRISATLSSLQGVVSVKTPPIDARLMQRLQNEQGLAEIPRGGDLRGLEVKSTVLQRIGAAIWKAARWTAARIVKFVDWLARFWPDSGTESKKAPAASNMRWTIGSLVALIILVLVVLAFEVIRRSRNSKPASVEESAPLRSTQDDDPLSRGANEWERYAAQLASAGRTREAIRAWYNAVLVTLYGANFLQFRKGRTNWEYVAALAPEVAWRTQIIHLTRRFEQEWYGSDRSSIEALDECSATARDILDSVRRAKREAA